MQASRTPPATRLRPNSDGTPPPPPLSPRPLAPAQNLPPGANPAGQLVSSNREGDVISPGLLSDSPVGPGFGWPADRGLTGLLARGPRPLVGSRSATSLRAASPQRPLPVSMSMTGMAPRALHPIHEDGPAASSSSSSSSSTASAATPGAMLAASASASGPGPLSMEAMSLRLAMAIQSAQADGRLAPGPLPAPAAPADDPELPAFPTAGASGAGHALAATDPAAVTERLCRRFAAFGAYLEACGGWPNPKSDTARQVYADLGGDRLLTGLGSLEPDQRDAAAVDAVLDRLADLVAILGRHGLSGQGFGLLRRAWQEGLGLVQRINRQRLRQMQGPIELQQHKLDILVRALGGTRAPITTLLELLAQARNAGQVDQFLMRDLARGMLGARLGQLRDPESEGEILSWLCMDLSSHAPASAGLVHASAATAAPVASSSSSSSAAAAAPASTATATATTARPAHAPAATPAPDTSGAMLRGCLEAFMGRHTGAEMLQLGLLVRRLLAVEGRRPLGSLAPLVSTALDVTGRALASRSSLMAEPRERQSSMTLHLLQAWSGGRERPPYRLLSLLLDGLANSRPTGPASARPESGARERARQIARDCIPSLPHAHERKAVLQALDGLEAGLGAGQPDPGFDLEFESDGEIESPSQDEFFYWPGPDPASAAAEGSRTAKRKDPTK